MKWLTRCAEGVEWGEGCGDGEDEVKEMPLTMENCRKSLVFVGCLQLNVNSHTLCRCVVVVSDHRSIWGHTYFSIVRVKYNVQNA